MKMRGFGERSDCSLSDLNLLLKDLAKAGTQWQDAIDDVPKSVRFRDPYITFLIEAASRSQDMVGKKAQTELITSGVHFQTYMGCSRLSGFSP
jgi:hypothetical protein